MKRYVRAQSCLSTGLLQMLIASFFLVHPQSGFSKSRKPSANADADSSVKSLFKSSHCSTQAIELVKKWNATEKWIRSPGDMDGGKVFSSPTSRVGVWVQLSFYPNQSIEARRVSRQASIWVSWKGQDCTPVMKPSLSDNSDDSTLAQFRDSDLQKIVDDQGSALIYAWSPHMTLSVKGFAEAQQLARKLNIAFVPLLDPQADNEFSKKTAASNSIPESALRRDGTLELAMRGMHIHFPTSIVVSNGHISKLYPGLWLNLDVYEKFVKGNLQ